ncbi:MspA family porin [Gordonia sp. VNK21]|uniref:MspA family porin n=1 Tax=Gordonia sp. VNK21 TaxID=3382483 RepID=UPI0038D363A9
MSRTITTPDGWQLTATKAKERVRSVPPLNQSSWTREGFVDLRGAAKIGGKGTVPVTAGTLTTSIQIGCNTDISAGLTTGISFGPSVGLSVSWPPSATLGAQVTPSISTTFRPGTITTVTLGTKKLADLEAGTEVRGVHLRVDGCLGPVSLRNAVTVAISTPRNDNTINVYGKPHYL